jgi:hypothetical protein
LQGALAAAVMLHRAGYDVWNWEDRALFRAFRWLHEVNEFPVLLGVIAGHVLATRSPSLFEGFHPGFAGLSFSLWWLPAIFYPYYAALALSALYHGTNGLFIAASVFGWSVPSGLRTGWGYGLPLTALGSILLLGIGALGGNLYEIPDPTDNEYARMWEEFGADLERK